MPSRRDYSNGDMLRMQREAEQRVIEMRNRSRDAMQEREATGSQRSGSWSSPTGRSRQLPSQPLRPAPPIELTQPSASNGEVQNKPIEQSRETHEEGEPETIHEAALQENVPQEAKDSNKEGATILGDIMGALGLEEDTLLIIGLLLILINQRADTTLLLALAYLLI